ncbi:glycosyltransferase family 4 protein [Candidatus Nitrosopelagicus sp.]|nr:glycosyltransferase family 4 protein [Candidatus Nitrosopelagicus sp.]
MKIALACPASLPAVQFGGILFLCVDLAREISKLGHTVTIYTTNLDFANDGTTFNKNLPKKEKILNFIIKRSNVWFRYSLFYVNPGMYFQMLKDNPDVIHTVGIKSFQSIVAAIISKHKRIPLVISDQGGLTTHPFLETSGIIKKILYKIQFPLVRFIINQATKITVPNEYEKNIFKKFTNESKIEIISNGINLETLIPSTNNFKEKYGITKNFILFVGRFSHSKGIDILLNAINILKNNIALKDLKFVIMGVDFGYEEKMFHLIKTLEIKNSIQIIRNPPRDDVISAYQECEFLILPSRWELSPLVPLEGFAFKKTIISTDTDGIPYTVKNNVNGLLFPQEDFQELSKLILELVTNIEKRNSLGLAGYDMVQNESNSKIMSKKTLDVYQNITKTAN